MQAAVHKNLVGSGDAEYHRIFFFLYEWSFLQQIGCILQLRYPEQHGIIKENAGYLCKHLCIPSNREHADPFCPSLPGGGISLRKGEYQVTEAPYPLPEGVE